MARRRIFLSKRPIKDASFNELLTLRPEIYESIKIFREKWKINPFVLDEDGFEEWYEWSNWDTETNQDLDKELEKMMKEVEVPMKYKENIYTLIMTDRVTLSAPADVDGLSLEIDNNKTLCLNIGPATLEDDYMKAWSEIKKIQRREFGIKAPRIRRATHTYRDAKIYELAINGSSIAETSKLIKKQFGGDLLDHGRIRDIISKMHKENHIPQNKRPRIEGGQTEV